MKNTLNVNIPASNSSSYPIIIGENLLENAYEYIQKYTNARKLLIVTNTTVHNLYAEKFTSSLKNTDVKYEFIILEDGEKFKNINSLNLIWDKSIEFKLERQDAIIALGGGVIGDIAGFAAASYLRGVDFIQVPTTLLSQVDSSVGGKVAINHQEGKNLIGAFYQPKLVLSDTSTLTTLNLKELKTGLAEVIKYAFIEKTCGLKTHKNFMAYLKENKDNIFSLNPTIMVELIDYCCQLKAAVVNQDEKEKGLRAILNFGHTIGHAIEKCTNYNTFTHGEAVAIGMKGVFYIAKERSLIKNNYYEESIKLIEHFELNYKIPPQIQHSELAEAMKLDKKVLSNKIRFVIPTNIAEVEILNNITNKELTESIETLY